jgi:hypothetical protein
MLMASLGVATIVIMGIVVWSWSIVIEYDVDSRVRHGYLAFLLMWALFVFVVIGTM